MRRLVTFTVAWLFVAVAATTAAWQGVALVTHEVTDDRPAALGASEVQARLDAAGPAAGSAPSSTTTSAPTAASTTTTTTTTAGAAGAGEPAPVIKTYRLTGGTATIEFSPTSVRGVAATPNPGFGVKKSEAEGAGWRVEFESDGHRSRLDAWWDNGPQARSREDSR